jgi:hypothetical protein
VELRDKQKKNPTAFNMMNAFGGDATDTSIRRGTDAGLTGVRTALQQQQAGDASLLAAALEAFLSEPPSDEDAPRTAGASPPSPFFQEPVQLSWQTPLDDEEGAGAETGAAEGAAEGHLVVTPHACIFVGATVDDDWYVPAVCLALHALQQDENGSHDASTPTAVYIQMDPDGDDDNGGLPWEWTLHTEQAPQLFAVLSRLVSLHPVDPHEDTNHLDEEDDEGGEDPFAPEDMVWASDVQQQQREDGEATDQDRQAMLERLDQVLVVPPEYEIVGGQPARAEGQFDDADEEDEDDEIL